MLISRFRLVSALLAVVVAGAVLVGVQTSAGAVGSAASVNVPENNCQNYACPDPTGWASARWYPHSDYPSFGGAVNGANCTNYVAWRLMRTVGIPEGMLGGLGNANTWDTRAAAKGYTVDRKPAPGSVAQWDWNHVAYVEKVFDDGTILVSESNIWLGTPSNRYWLRYKVVTASTVDHFIHFRAPGVPKAVLATGDFNGDGKADLIAQLASGTLRMFRGNGKGAFAVQGGTAISAGWGSLRIVAPGDFNGDKKSDLIGIASDGKMYLYRGNGKGGFILPRKYFSGGWGALRLVFSGGDFDGDKKADLLAVRADGTLALYPGNGKGGWKSKAVTIGAGFETATQLAAPGDVNGDGTPDIVAVWPDGTVTLYAGAGAAALPETGTQIATGWTDVVSIAGHGDVTGDGFADLWAVRGGNTLFLYSGNGTTLGVTSTQPGVLW